MLEDVKFKIVSRSMPTPAPTTAHQLTNFVKSRTAITTMAKGGSAMVVASKKKID